MGTEQTGTSHKHCTIRHCLWSLCYSQVCSHKLGCSICSAWGFKHIVLKAAFFLDFLFKYLFLMQKFSGYSGLRETVLSLKGVHRGKGNFPSLQEQKVCLHRVWTKKQALICASLRCSLRTKINYLILCSLSPVSALCTKFPSCMAVTVRAVGLVKV